MEKKNEVFVDFQSKNRKITLYIMCIGGWGGALWNMNEKTRKKGGETKEAAGGGARARGERAPLCVEGIRETVKKKRRREEERRRMQKTEDTRTRTRTTRD